MDLNGKTYASTITSQLMPYALNNTAEILSSNIQKNSNKNKKIIQDSSIPVFANNEPLFSTDDVVNTMENVVSIENGSKVNITQNITAQFISNGHLLGASSILVTIKYSKEKPIYLFFDVKSIPKDILNLPVNIITESTYGNSSKNEIKEVLDNNILESLR